MVSRSDLEHDIPLGNVIGLTEAIGSWRGPSVRLRFRDPLGREQEIELLLNDQQSFMEAFGSLDAANSAAASPKLSQAGYSAVAMLPLPEALRRYWLNLVPLCLLPTVAFAGFELYGIEAAWVVTPFFFLAFLLAMKPVASRRAPPTFWLVVIVLWVAVPAPASMLVQIIRWVRQL